ncbi:MAG: hypothetical protein KDA57_23570, partial [Planctomycetales bacterium]|nr:hypothetical protein [Planctomycetales bacterium]
MRVGLARLRPPQLGHHVGIEQVHVKSNPPAATTNRASGATQTRCPPPLASPAARQDSVQEIDDDVLRRKTAYSGQMLLIDPSAFFI